MSPTVGVQDSYLSPMTLAALEDRCWARRAVPAPRAASRVCACVSRREVR
jgi:hypothetical protein